MSRNQFGSAGDTASAMAVEYLSSLDNPKVAVVLAAYLAELEAGRRPSRSELLESNPEIASALAECFGRHGVHPSGSAGVCRRLGLASQ